MKATWAYTITTTDGYKAKCSFAGETHANTSEEAVTKIAQWFLSEFSEDNDPWEIKLDIKRVN